ncbi:hypothetical protein FRB99_003288, partial [Tulasnella sp. 403]
TRLQSLELPYSPPPEARGNQPPTRREINDFIGDQKQFSLYIQALQEMQDDAQSQFTSHFQIGGIHGRPYTPWDSSGGPEPVSEAWGGYCTHGSVLFPTWHRPYMALYEQVLQSHAVEIAKKYQVDQAGWLAAANTLRMPFWDWAVNIVPPPEVISDKQVTITLRDGTQKLVDNPLLAYTFKPIDPSFPRLGELIRFLQANQRDTRTQTYNLLTRAKTWSAFSNSTAGDDGSLSTSLEGIHDGIHFLIGGHMGFQDFAGGSILLEIYHLS